MALGLGAELFAIPLEAGRYLVYAPGPQSAFIADRGLVNRLADLQGPSRADRQPLDASLANLLASLGLATSRHVEGPRVPPPRTLRLVLQLSHTSTDGAPAHLMPSVLARQVITEALAAVESDQRLLTLVYDGVEASELAWRLLKDLTEWSRELVRGRQVESTVRIRGVPPVDRLQWLIESCHEITLHRDVLPRVGVDGPSPPSAQDQEWFGAVRRVSDSGRRCSVQLTVDREQVPLLVDGLHHVATMTRAREIELVPTFSFAPWHGSADDEVVAFIEAFRSAQRAIAALGTELDFVGARLGEVATLCGEQSNELMALPTGAYRLCTHHPQPEFPTFAAAYRAYLDGHGSRPYCYGCFAKFQCSGECAGTQTAADHRFVGSQRCHLIRELLTDRLVGAIAASGGLWWRGAPAAGVRSG